MKVCDLVKMLNLTVFCGEEGLVAYDILGQALTVRTAASATIDSRQVAHQFPHLLHFLQHLIDRLNKDCYKKGAKYEGL